VELIEIANSTTEEPEMKSLMNRFIAITQEDLNRGLSAKQKELVPRHRDE
jgi:hypothetical protein